MNQIRKTPRIKFRRPLSQDFYAFAKKAAYSKIFPWTRKPKKNSKKLSN